MKLIALDFDQCILPTPNVENSKGWCTQQFERNLIIIEHNLGKIVDGYLITSSWSKIFDFDSDSKSVKYSKRAENYIKEDNAEFFNGVMRHINTYLNGRIYGICKERRERYVQEMSTEHKILMIDDLDYYNEFRDNPNVKYTNVDVDRNPLDFWRVLSIIEWIENE